jgi:hypothetical protein
MVVIDAPPDVANGDRLPFEVIGSLEDAGTAPE